MWRLVFNRKIVARGHLLGKHREREGEFYKYSILPVIINLLL